MMQNPEYRYRNVWIFARPLSVAQWLRPLRTTPQARSRLCDRGVLVSDMSFAETKQFINLALRKQKYHKPWSPETLLGKIYQLDTKRRGAPAMLTRSFRLGNLETDWSAFACIFVGHTSMTDPEISDTG